MITSKKYSLDLLDAGKGLVVAVFTAVVGALMACIHDGHVNIDPKVIGGYALAGALAYLGKNLLTPAQVVLPVSSIDNPKPTYTIAPVGVSLPGVLESTTNPSIPAPVAMYSQLISEASTMKLAPPVEVSHEPERVNIGL